MATVLTFEDLIDFPVERSPEQHFETDHLRRLFVEKIAKSRATGKDGIRVGIFEDNLTENVEIIRRKVLGGRYAFTAYKERLLLKGVGKAPRQICIPTVRDRLVLRAVCQILHSAIPQSTGFSPHAVVDRVATQLRLCPLNSSFIRIDVKEFFPSIRHDLLAAELARFGLDEMTRELCMNAVACRIGSAEQPESRGIAQGLSISGALACIYLLRFDDRQTRRFHQYFRYVDDILMISPAAEAQARLNSMRRSLGRLGLAIHPVGTSGKTEISDIADGVDYLGYHIQREIISVRESSFRRMFNNLLKVITDYRYRGDVERLIFRLNLKITGCIADAKRRGWMMFFSRTENLKQLAHLDSFVQNQLNRVGLPAEHRSRIKRFIKSYHEICFNLDQTDYIPKFDEYDLNAKAEVVAILMGRPLEEVQAFEADSIERNFSRLVGQEVHDLENDVGNPS
ncbi:reverse transcriptase domain-containing protein [Qipengyuania psychrotolerans]|uniref:Reverse transcriptase domain-containing protein n=1 Tax=Qipengyuania psychrotolerans TaxID=2867238 RepID=A0ABX8ZEA0_9SPHN|nr:reverse transcriptase domain-containing protein [Qipengyuania psychrotolerans]QZD86068.1 hypothetical protein K3166_07175 [Qipengyuania psychrotolerans]